MEGFDIELGRRVFDVLGDRVKVEEFVNMAFKLNSPPEAGDIMMLFVRDGGTGRRSGNYTPDLETKHHPSTKSILRTYTAHVLFQMTR